MQKNGKLIPKISFYLLSDHTVCVLLCDDICFVFRSQSSFKWALESRFFQHQLHCWFQTSVCNAPPILAHSSNIASWACPCCSVSLRSQTQSNSVFIIVSVFSYCSRLMSLTFFLGFLAMNCSPTPRMSGIQVSQYTSCDVTFSFLVAF